MRELASKTLSAPDKAVVLARVSEFRLRRWLVAPGKSEVREWGPKILGRCACWVPATDGGKVSRG